MVRGDLSDDLGGVLLVFCKIYLVGDASFLQNGLDIIPYLMPQPGAGVMEAFRTGRLNRF